MANMIGREFFDGNTRFAGVPGPWLLSALEAVTDRIPDEDLKTLGARRILIAPLGWAWENLGSVRDWPEGENAPAWAGPMYRTRPDGEAEIGGWLVELSPAYEARPRRAAINVISHEFAHVFLRHGEGLGSEVSRGREAEAWRQQAAWGFAEELTKGMDELLSADNVDARVRADIERELPALRLKVA